MNDGARPRWGRTPSLVLASGRLQHPFGLRQRFEEPLRRITADELQLEAVVRLPARHDPRPATEVIEQDDAGPGGRIDPHALRGGVDGQGRLATVTVLHAQFAHLAVAVGDELTQVLNIGVTRDDETQCSTLLFVGYPYVARLN